jgi:agmatinase
VDKINYSLFGIPWKDATAKVAVFGVAYDSSSELTKGALAFPAATRLASYGVEWDHNFDATDFGDLLPPHEVEKMSSGVKEFLDDLWHKGFRKFFVMGGNHSITIPVAEFLAEKGLKKYVHFDAHADFRDEWTDTKKSFACVLRRVREVVSDVSLIGVRSVAEEEKDVYDKVHVLEGKDFSVEKAKKMVEAADYISVDMDVFPISEVTNPEPAHGVPFGSFLETLSGKKMGFDIVEGVPQKIYSDFVGTKGALIARQALRLLDRSIV